MRTVGLLIVVGLMGVLTAGWWFSSLLLTAIAGALGIVYGGLLLKDLIRVSSLLERLLRRDGQRIDNGSACGTSATPGAAGSSIGEYILRLVQALGHRLQLTQWELESSVAGGKSAVNQRSYEPSDRESSSERPWYERSEEELARDFIEQLGSRFRHSAAAVALGSDRIVTHGYSGETFRTVCLRALRQALQYRAEVPRDSSLHSLFGFRQSFTHHFRVGEREAVIWLGYGIDRAPSRRERERLSQAAEELSQQLLDSQEKRQLAVRVRSAEQRSESSARLITEISHDIRSPLNNIKSILQVLRLEGVPEEVDQFLGVALRNCEGLEEMVNSLIDLSRSQTGTLVARPELVEAGMIVTAVTEGFRGVARARGLRFEVVTPPYPVMLKVDRVQLKRILSNLISNAFKYTEAGSVEVRVTGGTQESGMSEIVVEDTGLGMTQEQIGKLFTPFTRFHTERAEGIGLGLALTKSLVELNDGTILVSSQAGSGTSCSLTFPCVSEEQLSASGISNHFEKRGTSISSLLPQFVALIVDDDRDSVDSLARVLSTRGISVQRAYSVSQARRVLAETSIGIIITDFRMPDGGLSALLQPMPERLMPPYVVLTGEAHLQLPAEYSPAAILSKPVDVAILMEVISSVREGTLPLARVA